jgi:asparagine synthase (glutamine-hydrolysing)
MLELVALARPHTKERLQCFTIALDGGGADVEGMVDDLPYAQRVAAHLGVDLHTVKVGPEMVDSLPKMIYHLDEPQADPAACCEFVIPAEAGIQRARLDSVSSTE